MDLVDDVLKTTRGATIPASTAASMTKKQKYANIMAKANWAAELMVDGGDEEGMKRLDEVLNQSIVSNLPLPDISNPPHRQNKGRPKKSRIDDSAESNMRKSRAVNFTALSKELHTNPSAPSLKTNSDVLASVSSQTQKMEYHSTGKDNYIPQSVLTTSATAEATIMEYKSKETEHCIPPTVLTAAATVEDPVMEGKPSKKTLGARIGLRSSQSSFTSLFTWPRENTLIINSRFYHYLPL